MALGAYKHPVSGGRREEAGWELPIPSGPLLGSGPTLLDQRKGRNNGKIYCRHSLLPKAARCLGTCTRIGFCADLPGLRSCHRR
ncbi:hypothetical protein AGR8A_Lc10818 [Agrobacterium fabrum str. J-07]|nr:hypothetical protein AGR8A_Lc10818 [Agrobacterium fabrum str. J-07]